MNADAIVMQLTPVFGEEKARFIASMAMAISGAIRDTPLDQFEDAMLLPAMGAMLGYYRYQAGIAKAARIAQATEMPAGVAGTPSLYNDEDVEKALAATNAPEPPNPIREYRLNKAMAEYASALDDEVAQLVSSLHRIRTQFFRHTQGQQMEGQRVVPLYAGRHARGRKRR